MNNKELFPTTGKFMFQTKLVSHKLCTTCYDVSRNVVRSAASFVSSANSIQSLKVYSFS